MANKKKIEELELARRKKQTERTIQIGAGVLGGLIIIALIWLAFANRSSSQSAIPTIDMSQITPQEQPTQSSQQPTPGATTAVKQYSAYPPMTIDVNKKYFATFKMAKGGEFKVQLFPDKAPKTVNSFVFLAKQGFYDGVTFHRVLEGFMAQGGDPTGTGMGGPGYEFENEKNDLQFDKPGVVAMANAGPNTNGSQFFIMFNAYGLSESDYTIFGQVVEGMDVVNGITRRNPDENPTFPGDAIQTIEITEE